MAKIQSGRMEFIRMVDYGLPGVVREDLGVDLDEHIAFVIAALQTVSAELGLTPTAESASEAPQ